MIRPFPATPGRAVAHLGESVNNAAGGGAMYSSTTPNRRTTLTPSRYIPPSPLPESQSSSQQHQQTLPAFVPLKHRVVAHDPQLKAVMEQDAASVDAALRALRDGKSERRRQHEGMKVELVEEERWWENECERLRKEGADVVKSLEREKVEAAEAASLVTSLENRKRALAGQVDALRADSDEWAARIRVRKDYNEQERLAYENQAEKDGPELAFFEETLGLQIMGKPDDIVSFRFTLLDPADHKRTFVFDLDASQPSYTVPFCKPSLPPARLKVLVYALNQNRDLYTFLINTRAAFVELASIESRERHGGFGR